MIYNSGINLSVWSSTDHNVSNDCHKQIKQNKPKQKAQTYSIILQLSASIALVWTALYQTREGEVSLFNDTKGRKGKNKIHAPIFLLKQKYKQCYCIILKWRIKERKWKKIKTNKHTEGTGCYLRQSDFYPF